MNLAQITHVSTLLGNAAQELDFAIEAYGDQVPEEKLKRWSEIRDIMFKGERTIGFLLKEKDLMSAYIWNEHKNIKYNRELVEQVLELHGK
jgi:hypothetical protein